jgi:nucleotidyltransferase substrate binding protein (TIGR01987 family)
MTTPKSNITGFQGKFLNFEKALNRLNEVLDLYREEPHNTIYQDALIKRHEFTWELAWKTLYEYMNEAGIEVMKATKPTLKQAFRIDLIQSQDIWQDMAEDRNFGVHRYDESEAKALAQRIITSYNKTLSDLYFTLKHIYDTEYNA